MKKIMNKINFAIIGLMVSIPAFAAPEAQNGMCALITRLKQVFSLIRIFAFVGAAFLIAAWAWDFITKADTKLEDVKKKGIGLLVGFSLLFMVGAVISFILSATGQATIGCYKELTTGW